MAAEYRRTLIAIAVRAILDEHKGGLKDGHRRNIRSERESVRALYS